MTLRDFIGALSRRWVVSVSVLLLTLVAAGLLGRPRPTFVAQETFAVQPPASPQLPNQLNTFRPSLAMTAAVVAQRLKTPQVESQLRAEGVVGDYDVLPRNSGTVQTPAYIIPSLQVVVTTHDRDAALRSVALVIRAFDNELSALQDQVDVAVDQRITTAVIAPASAALQLPSKSRALAAIGILGLSTALLAPLWYERLASRWEPRARRGRRRRKGAWRSPRGVRSQTSHT